MANFGLIVAGEVVDSVDGPAPDDGGTWVELPYGVGISWLYDGTDFTDVYGNSPPVEPAPVMTYRTLLSGAEWVETFTEQEWAWLKVQRATVDRLDQMMDAIRWLGAVDVGSGNLNEFYDWMVANGLPGGQARADELRQGVETGYV